MNKITTQLIAEDPPVKTKNGFPTCFDIALWWIRHDLDNTYVKTIDMICCMACGGYRSRDPEKKLTEKVLRDAWGHSGLHRHHIKAQTYGGDDSLGNLQNLCPRCHEEVPSSRDDELNREMYSRWRTGRRHVKDQTHCAMFDSYGFLQVEKEMMKIYTEEHLSTLETEEMLDHLKNSSRVFGDLILMLYDVSVLQSKAYSDAQRLRKGVERRRR